MPIYELGPGHKPVLPPEGEYWVAPNATLIGKVRLEREASVWWGAVVRADQEVISIGEGTNIQDGSVCHADPGKPLTIGRGCTVGHMVMLHGCTIGDGSLIGIGAIILNEARIGAGSLVGAGALVTEGKAFPGGSLIIGAPARVARALTEEEQDMLKRAAHGYVRNWRRFGSLLTSL
jgi:carbonic anhydrase/acetyltransferase-like protein (isoleucine patch superfamily)